GANGGMAGMASSYPLPCGKGYDRRVRPDRQLLLERHFDPLWTERQVAKPLAGRMGDRIDDRSARRALRALARSERRLIRPVEQFDGNLWNVRHGQDRIARPVPRRDAVPVEAHLLQQRPARRLDDAALDLVLQAIGIDHQARVDGSPRLRDAD